MLARLRFGQYYQLFQNRFPLTARLAWGVSLPGDPELGAWLFDEHCYAEHGNGIVVFAPKLLLRAKSDPSKFTLTKLNGVMRWRHVANTYLLWEIQNMLGGLRQCARHIRIASACGDVEIGRRTLASAHLCHVSVILDPYNQQAVRAVMQSHGWVHNGEHWYRRPKAEGCGSIILMLRGAASKPIPNVHQVKSNSDERILHLEGPVLALELARMVMTIRSGHHVGELLDHVQDILTNQETVVAFKRLANQEGDGLVADQTVKLIERLCGGAFMSSLPSLVESS